MEQYRAIYARICTGRCEVKVRTVTQAAWGPPHRDRWGVSPYHLPSNCRTNRVRCDEGCCTCSVVRGVPSAGEIGVHAVRKAYTECPGVERYCACMHPTPSTPSIVRPRSTTSLGSVLLPVRYSLTAIVPLSACMSRMTREFCQWRNLPGRPLSYGVLRSSHKAIGWSLINCVSVRTTYLVCWLWCCTGSLGWAKELLGLCSGVGPRGLGICQTPKSPRCWYDNSWWRRPIGCLMGLAYQSPLMAWGTSAPQSDQMSTQENTSVPPRPSVQQKSRRVRMWWSRSPMPPIMFSSVLCSVDGATHFGWRSFRVEAYLHWRMSLTRCLFRPSLAMVKDIKPGSFWPSRFEMAVWVYRSRHLSCLSNLLLPCT